MSTEDNNQNGGAPENAGEDKAAELEALKAQLAERDAEISKYNQTIGSLKRQVKDLSKSEEPKETPQQTTPQSNEPDYARLAYLESKQITHPDDQKRVMEEAARLKLPLTDVLAMEHVKAQLKNAQDQRTAEAATPDGKGRKGGPNKGEVDYYLAHPDEVPEDLELHNKVIDAKLKKEENATKWASVPFIG